MPGKIRALMVGAHPDDCEICFGGIAALYAEAGHEVLFLVMTDGGAGHQIMKRDALIKHRQREAAQAAEILGVNCKILPVPDGRLQADLKTRQQLLREVRRFRPDVIFTHRLDDYHPDHRATVQLVYDISFVCIVPKIFPRAKPLPVPPVILHAQPAKTKTRLDVYVEISRIWKRKLLALDAHASQMYEWLPWTSRAEVPSGADKRLAWLEKNRKKPGVLLAAACRKKKKTCGFRLVEGFSTALPGVGAETSRAVLDKLLPFGKIITGA
jgi:LmbE family N-acetylglucosaminyl deacetylase